MISMPACPASGASLATIAGAPNTARRPAFNGHAAGNTAGRRSAEYNAGPRSGARLGEPMSVAERGGVCALRHERRTAAKAATRRTFRFIEITTCLSESESSSKSQHKLTTNRVLVPGYVGALMHAEEAFLHERDLHVR